MHIEMYKLYYTDNLNPDFWIQTMYIEFMSS